MIERRADFKNHPGTPRAPKLVRRRSALDRRRVCRSCQLGEKAKFSLRADVFRCSPNIGMSARQRMSKPYRFTRTIRARCSVRRTITTPPRAPSYRVRWLLVPEGSLASNGSPATSAPSPAPDRRGLPSGCGGSAISASDPPSTWWPGER
jgi:hypothetical protein